MPSLPHVFHKTYAIDLHLPSTHRLLQPQHKQEGESESRGCLTLEMPVEDLCFLPLNGAKCPQKCGNYSAFRAASFFCATEELPRAKAWLFR